MNRERERAVLDAALGRMLEGRGSVVFVSGEAGIGKTALVDHWRRALPSSAHDDVPLDVEARCAPGAAPLAPWGAIVAEVHARAGDEISLPHAPVAAREPAGGVKRAVIATAPEWVRAIPFVGYAVSALLETRQLARDQRDHSRKLDVRKLVRDAAPAWAWALPVVGDVAHAAVETVRLAREQHEPVAADAAKEIPPQIFQQYVALLAAISAARPLRITLDDAQHADRATLNMLFHLHRIVPAKRILVILCYRDGDPTAESALVTIKNEVFRYSAGAEIPLGPLDRDAITAWVAARTGRAPTDAAFLTWLIEMTGGNPLFIETYLHALEQAGVLQADALSPERYRATPLPRPLRELVKAHLARFDAATLGVLRCAALIGRRFTAGTVARVLSMKTLTLLHLLKGAETARVLRAGMDHEAAGVPAMAFEFVREPERRVLLDAIGIGERTRLEAAIARSAQSP